jgi:hypothetical protein
MKNEDAKAVAEDEAIEEDHLLVLVKCACLWDVCDCAAWVFV